MAEHNDLGKLGEQLAVDYLLENHYEILERNWISGKAEIDIIAKKEDTLAIIEVKTRSSTAFGLPQDFINQKKITMIVKAVDNYVTSNDLDVNVRFDIIAISKSQNNSYNLEHLIDAYYYF